MYIFVIPPSIFLTLYFYCFFPLNYLLLFFILKKRNKQVYHESIRHFLKDSSSKSKTFMAEFHSNLSSTRKDINKYKNEFEMSLKWVARSEKETNEKKKKEIEENNC